MARIGQPEEIPSGPAAQGTVRTSIWSAIHPTLLYPLLVMALAYVLLFVTLHLAAMRNEIMRRRVRTLMLMQADAAAGR